MCRPAARSYSAFAGPSYTLTGYSTSAPYLEGNTFDSCGGHSSSTSSPSYHYHVAPSCLLAQLGMTNGAHSPQIGWMADGFPVYGPLGPNGVVMQVCPCPRHSLLSLATSSRRARSQRCE